MKLPMNYREKVDDVLEACEDYFTIEDDKKEKFSRAIKYNVSILNEKPEGGFVDLSIVNKIQLDALNITRIDHKEIESTISDIRKDVRLIKDQIRFSVNYENLVNSVNYGIMDVDNGKLNYRKAIEIISNIKGVALFSETIPGCDPSILDSERRKLELFIDDFESAIEDEDAKLKHLKNVERKGHDFEFEIAEGHIVEPSEEALKAESDFIAKKEKAVNESTMAKDKASSLSAQYPEELKSLHGKIKEFLEANSEVLVTESYIRDMESSSELSI